MITNNSSGICSVFPNIAPYQISDSIANSPPNPYSDGLQENGAETLPTDMTNANATGFSCQVANHAAKAGEK